MKNMMNKQLTIPEYLDAILAELKKLNKEKTEKKPKKNADNKPAKEGAEVNSAQRHTDEGTQEESIQLYSVEETEALLS